MSCEHCHRQGQAQTNAQEVFVITVSVVTTNGVLGPS